MHKRVSVNVQNETFVAYTESCQLCSKHYCLKEDNTSLLWTHYMAEENLNRPEVLELLCADPRSALTRGDATL